MGRGGPGLGYRLFDLAIRLTGRLLVMCLLAGPRLARAEDADTDAEAGAIGHAVVESITVTATKREADAQEIPLSIEVLVGERLSDFGVEQFDDLSAFVPNFTAGFGIASESITMRGLGSGQEQSFEQSVAMFSDGLYLPRSRQYVTPLLDIERVEVMRGPQAVIHGLNATAGAVSIVTRRSVPGDPFTLDLTAGYELEHRGPSLTAVFGGSPSPKLGLRAALRLADGGGYFENTTLGREEGDAEQLGGRLSAVWTPSEKASLSFSIERSETETESSVGEIYGLTAPLIEPGDGGLDWRRSSEASLIDPFDAFAEDRPGTVAESTRLILDLDLTLGGGTLSLVAGHSDFDYRLTTDLDATGAAFFDAAIEEAYAQTGLEARFATSPGGDRFTWVVGAYAHHTDLVNLQPTVLGPAAVGPGLAIVATALFDLESDLWSAFFQGTWRLSDRLRLVGGARFTGEEKSVLRRNPRCDLGILPDTLAPAPQVLADALCASDAVDGFTDRRTATNFMPELALEWDAADGMLVYAKASRSAKDGGYAASTRAQPEDLEYDDEQATGFELGLRSRLGGGAVTFDAALFHTDYEDLQVNSFVFVESGSIQTARPVIRNAASARSRGLEVAGRWAASRSLLLGASLAWLDAEYEAFPDAPCNTVDAAPSGVCDQSGRDLPFAADWSANVFLDFDRPLGEGRSLLAGLDVAASDGYFTDGSLDPNAVQDSWVRVSARLGLALHDRRWSVALVGRNLTEEAVLASSQVFTDAYFIGYLGAPRTIGLQTTYRIR